MEKTEDKNHDLLSSSYWNGMIKMSLSKFFVLLVLQRQRLHGYDIIREVERCSDGCCSPREGTIYPVLKQFEQGGYVDGATEVVGGRERKVYSVTDKGRQAFQVARREWLSVAKTLTDESEGMEADPASCEC